MRMQAIFYEDGRVVLNNPLRLKTYPVKIELIIPDEYTEPLPEKFRGKTRMPLINPQNTQLIKMINEIRAVLGSRYGTTDDGKTDGEKFATELEAAYR